MEGVDPPKRQHTQPNMSCLLFANLKGGPGDFGFLLSICRNITKKPLREKECFKDLSETLDRVPFEKSEAWFKLGTVTADPQGADVERVTKLVQEKCPKATIDIAEPVPFVMVSGTPFAPIDKSHGLDPELKVLDKFDAGFGELLREARRVSGLVHKQWFVAILWVRPEQKDATKPFALGIGFATERSVARARAVHSAEARVSILSDEMFKSNVKLKSQPDK